MNFLTLGGLAVITTGLTEVAKKSGLLPKRLIPVKALILGVVVALVGKWAGMEMNYGLTVLTGLVLGLSATGIYEGLKTTVLGK